MTFKSAMLAATILTASTVSAFAASVDGGIIFGTGVTNGDFTIGTGTYEPPLAGTATVELGLRGKLRFNASNNPENTFNYNGVDTYTFQAGAAPGGFGFDPNSLTTPLWNFEFSINSDLGRDPSVGETSLSQLTYELRLDTDAGAGTSFAIFDPIITFYADHGLSNDSGSGPYVASDPLDYAGLISTMSRAQNSWNYEFFNEPLDGPAYQPLLAGFDPNALGSYRIELAAFYQGNQVASTGINVNVVGAAVPLPAGLPLLIGGLGALGVIRRRRKA